MLRGQRHRSQYRLIEQISTGGGLVATMIDGPQPPNHAPDTWPYLTATELQDEGYLQEVNRVFWHPLGLAMVCGFCTHTGQTDPKFDHTPEDCTWPNGFYIGIVDWRDDDEGNFFDKSNLPEAAKARKVRDRWHAKQETRAAFARKHGFRMETLPLGPIQQATA